MLGSSDYSKDVLIKHINNSKHVGEYKTTIVNLYNKRQDILEKDAESKLKLQELLDSSIYKSASEEDRFDLINRLNQQSSKIYEDHEMIKAEATSLLDAILFSTTYDNVIDPDVDTGISDDEIMEAIDFVVNHFAQAMDTTKAAHGLPVNANIMLKKEVLRSYIVNTVSKTSKIDYDPLQYDDKMIDRLIEETTEARKQLWSAYSEDEDNKLACSIWLQAYDILESEELETIL